MKSYGNPYYNMAKQSAIPANIAYQAGKKVGKYIKSKYSAPKPVNRRRRPIKKRALKTKSRNLVKRVNDLSKKLNSSTGELIYHLRGVDSALSAVNQLAHHTCFSHTMTSYETVLAQLRFFNPSAPATLIQGSGASGTYYREYLFKSVYTRFNVRNNYQVPCKVTIYCCTPKEDTSISAVTAFTNGLADVGNPTSSSMLLHLTDSGEFNDLWRINKSVSKILQPGSSTGLVYSIKDMLYNPATNDSHALSFQRQFKCFEFIVRVEGVLAHDSSADQQGFSAAGVDSTWHTKYSVSYDAGISLKFIYLDDTVSAFTNGAVISNKPVSDNQSYSVA